MAPLRRSPSRKDASDLELEEAVLIEDATEGRIAESALILEVDSALADQRRRRCGCLRGRPRVLLCAATAALLLVVALAIHSGTKAAQAGGSAPNAEEMGFQLLRSELLEDYNYTGNMYRHVATGAMVLSVIAPDSNKAVGLAFKTPVVDDKGKPHILEHSVLEGSDHFPVHHPPPFDRINQGSTTTFLNALTYPDRTLYPVSSPSLKEFHNVARVYMDAVFRPLVRKKEIIFRQEGWRLELANASDPQGAELVGVVYNEMQGAYSDKGNWLERLYTQQLFPDTGYRFDSGGFPTEIPSLEYAELQEFHAQHYHPSNARVWFYGDDPEEERLRLLSAALEGFGNGDDQGASAIEIKTQPRFASPRKANGTYPAAEGDKAIAAVAWVLTHDTKGFPEEDRLAMDLLEDLLIGNPTSPMYAALRSSGLGTPYDDMLGIDTSIAQPVMVAAMQDVDPKQIPAAQALVLETLQRLAAEGFEPDDVEAAINSYVVSTKRAVSESGSWGVHLFERIAGPWVWDRDPFDEFRRIERPVAALRMRLEAKEDVFGDLLRKYLIDNPHRVDLALLPSLEMANAQKGREQEIVAGLLGTGPGAPERWAHMTADMAAYHAAEDPPEAANSVPRLGIADMDPEYKAAPMQAEQVPGGTLLLLPQPTAGIAFFRVALRLEGIASEEDMAYMPMAVRMIREAGTETESPRELEARIGRLTGGVDLAAMALDEAAGDEAAEGRPPAAVPVLLIEGSAEGRHVADVAVIIEDLLLRNGLGRNGTGDLAGEILDSWIAETETDMLGDGLSPARSRAQAMASPAAWIDEQVGGLAQLEALRGMRSDLEAAEEEDGWPQLRDKLRGIIRAVLAPPPSATSGGACVPLPIVSVTADEATLETSARQAAVRLLRSLRDAAPGAGFCGGGDEQGPRQWPTLEARSEAVQIANGNNYVVEVSGRLQGLANGGAKVAVQVLNNFLHTELRAKRGAYGAYARVTDWGMLSLFTYRDPGLATTIEIFRNASQYMMDWASKPDEQEFEAAVVNAAASVDPFLPPSTRGSKAMMHYISGCTQEKIQQRKTEILSASAEDVRTFGEVMAGAHFNLVAATTDVEAVGAVGEPMFDVVVPIVKTSEANVTADASEDDSRD